MREHSCWLLDGQEKTKKKNTDFHTTSEWKLIAFSLGFLHVFLGFPNDIVQGSWQVLIELNQRETTEKIQTTLLTWMLWNLMSSSIMSTKHQTENNNRWKEYLMELQGVSFRFSNLNHMERRCNLKYLIRKQETSKSMRRYIVILSQG